MPHNKQFELTVIRRHVRAASASLHYAVAARWSAQRAAAELRRYTARTAYRSGKSVATFGPAPVNHRAVPCDPALVVDGASRYSYRNTSSDLRAAHAAPERNIQLLGGMLEIFPAILDSFLP